MEVPGDQFSMSATLPAGEIFFRRGLSHRCGHPAERAERPKVGEPPVYLKWTVVLGVDVNPAGDLVPVCEPDGTAR